MTSNNRLERPVTLRNLRAMGALRYLALMSRINRPCGRSSATLDVPLVIPVPSSAPLSRVFVAFNRVFGLFAVAGGLLLLAKCAWHLLRGVRDWSQSYFAVLFALTLTIVGIVYVRAPLWRQRSQESVK